MATLKHIARNLPVVSSLYRAWRRRGAARRLQAAGVEGVFTDIYQRNEWRGEQSVSGTGSDVSQTAVVARAISELIRDRKVSSILDIPCGDFAWMKHVDLHNATCLGGDIVRELIEHNNERYGNERVSFRHMDLLRDELPRVDLVLCRDCLVHFSFDDVRRALRNICASGSTYLLTTTFTDRTANRDIVTGQWRPLNLQAAPFRLPPPMQVINEQCTEENGIYQDKSLGLWRIDEIAKCL